MGFPLEVVGVGRKNITARIHIKYVRNMDLNIETNGIDGNILKK
jgi:hypothetical protein